MKCSRREEIAGSPTLPVHWLQPIKASKEFATRSLRGVSAVKAALCSLSPGIQSHTGPGLESAELDVCSPSASPLAASVVSAALCHGHREGLSCAIPWPGRAAFAAVGARWQDFRAVGLDGCRSTRCDLSFSPVLPKLSQSNRNPFLH